VCRTMSSEAAVSRPLERLVLNWIWRGTLNELALFAGAGGGILGGQLLGWRTVCAVEVEPFCRDILLRRQNDGHLDPFPLWDDVRTFDGRPWRGVVDVVSGGFPCQDISSCNHNATGIEGERSGLWTEMARIIGEVRPRFVLVENSPMLVGRGLARVLGDLAEVGPYDCRWGCIGADDASAPHVRKRCWIVGTLADAASTGLEGHAGSATESNPRSQQGQSAAAGMATVADSASGGGRAGLCEAEAGEANRAERKPESCDGSCAGKPGTVPDAENDAERLQATRWCRDWPAEPDLPRMAHGVADRLDREKATGNGQVPRVVALAWDVLC